MLTLILQSLVDGILMGGIYGLVAIGLTLIFGVMKIINFAQGALLMLGMYISYWSFSLLGLNPYLSIPLSAISLFFIGAIIQKTILSKMLNAPEHNQLLVTLGIMLVIENLALILWSPDFRSVKLEGFIQTFNIGEVGVNVPKLIAFIAAIVLSIGLFLFLKKTMLGKAIRATSINRNGAMLSGINTNRINYIAFGLGASLAAIAGSLITPFFYTSPTVGATFILKGFVVVVLGGLGNFIGAIIGGLIIGISEALGGAFLPGSLKELMTYIIFVIVLMAKPNGLFGGKAR
ncbi:branched-chain amino acid ABC transporter permease [Cytobacillus sp. FSL R5-0569]|uniref:Branched-chain amino acid ABC transporter permease n=1 Tax=Cytobacillus stercorigallinarum TaxID=2762240 RepID=A0ABR8QM01_9BACI|nr:MULTISPECIES: branched-chain amino acid ABC transporter permease [Cytobacillus]MBD7936382.1 branched-chain amino acid ABC transporter permease [Cytobacillus stercorigallinarum]MEA1852278.1 branched-chain amino acid ABC transporter permease [Cytobacillus sp. OWB-43]